MPQTRHPLPQKRPRHVRKGLVLWTLIAGHEPAHEERVAVLDISGGGKASVETQVRTPQMVFMQPQRLVVPLFQRPYVWNEENQWRSEEHTSELQSRLHLVCRLLLEKKKKEGVKTREMN